MVRKYASPAQAALNQKKAEAGLVSERFPGVSKMVIRMEYNWILAEPAFMVRTINVYPHDYAYFQMDCKMSGCTSGGFDLSRVISRMARNRKKTGEGRMLCSAGNRDGLDPAHASISYTIKIEYNGPKSK